MERILKRFSPDLVVMTDGSCEPYNPGGNMGWGFVVLGPDMSEHIYEESDFAEEGPENSNNVAEYMALNDAMLWLIKNGHSAKRILFLSDSKLVVNQMSGWWRIKDGLYKSTAKACEGLRSEWFKDYAFAWIPREMNGYADALSKERQDDVGMYR